MSATAILLSLSGWSVAVTLAYRLLRRRWGPTSPEEELCRSREARLERFEAMVEHAGVECYLIGLDGSLEYANRAAAASLGYTVPELLALGLSGIDPVRGSGIQEQVESLRRGDVSRFESVHTARDGHAVPKEFNAALLHHDKREYVCYYGQAISERRRAEVDRIELDRRVRQTERLESLAALAGGVAHDFSNALTAVLGNLELATEELPLGGSPARTSICEAIDAARRAVDLTRQMLVFSGRNRLHLTPLDLAAFFSAVAGPLRALLPAHLTLNLHADPGLPTVMADAVHLQQALTNLVSNACNAMVGASGTIRVTATARAFDAAALQSCPSNQRPAAGSFVVIEVTDSGPGMDATAVDHLFEPFFTTKRGARGLGLPMVLGIAKGLHGTVFVDSTPGAGTAVRLLIPVPPTAPLTSPLATRSKAAATPQARTLGTVLIVDDEASVRSLASRMVERLGFRVITAVDGLEAIEQIRSHGGEITCVLLDLIMPRLDGIGAFTAMRKIRPDIKVILCSGFSDPQETQRLIVSGANGFLQKPFAFGQLQEALTRAIQTPVPSGG